MKFRHEIIDDSPPCGRLTICQTTDLTGNSRPDLIIGGLGSETLPIIGTGGIPLIGRILKKLETSVFWYENPGWERHKLSSDSQLYVIGNTLGDINGNSRQDLIVGQGIGARHLYWFEQPVTPRQTWKRYTIGSYFDKYHDLAFGDIDNDGEPELIGASQESNVIFYLDIPDDPYQEPWPEECLHIIQTGKNVEGLEVVDIDNDGQNELIAGTSMFKLSHPNHNPGTNHLATVAMGNNSDNAPQDRVITNNRWSESPIVTGWDWTRVCVGDIDNDNELEVVFAEGDSPLYGSGAGRVGIFDPPRWSETILHDDLNCLHTVAVADFNESNYLDIFVAEMEIDHNDPKLIVFENDGNGSFHETIIHTGRGTHEAKVADINGNGKLDIVGKSYGTNPHVDVWYNETS